MGDVFGTTVNLASRLTALAKPGSTLIDAETRDCSKPMSATPCAPSAAGRCGFRCRAPVRADPRHPTSGLTPLRWWL